MSEAYNEQVARERHLKSIPDTTIGVGDTVVWRGSWGDDAPKEAKLINLERTKHEHEKEGWEVDEVQFINGEWEFPFVCTLDNNHWAYSYQIEPVK